mgnify:CR=1 FL=1
MQRVCASQFLALHRRQTHVLPVSVGFALFFFQAEDGIRDLVRSRGLGDVYKRQTQFGSGWAWLVDDGGLKVEKTANADLPLKHGAKAVSYTHLTLPTSDLV